MTKELKSAIKLTVFVGDAERHAHHALYQEVLRILHREDIVGATVMRGVLSFGVKRSIHSIMNEIAMDNLPVIIEAIDEPTKIEHVATIIAEMLGEHGLIEVQATRMVHKGTEPLEGSSL